MTDKKEDALPVEAEDFEVSSDPSYSKDIEITTDKGAFNRALMKASLTAPIQHDPYIAELAKEFKKNHALIVHTAEFGVVHKRIYNMCLRKAQRNLLVSQMHYISYKEVMEELGWSKDGGKYREVIMDRLTELNEQRYSVRYLGEYEGDDKDAVRSLRKISVLSSVIEAEDHSGFRFTLDPIVIHLMQDEEFFAHINSVEQRHLDKSSTITLHEIALLFLGKGKDKGQTYTKSVQEWRAILGVDAKTYESFKEFNRSYLTPGMNNINAECDFTIEMVKVFTGRAVTALYFKMERKSPSIKAIGTIDDVVAEPIDLDLEDELRFRLSRIGLSKAAEKKAWANGMEWVSSFCEYIEDRVNSGSITKNVAGYAAKVIKEGAAFGSALEKEAQNREENRKKEKSLFEEEKKKTEADQAYLFKKIREKKSELESSFGYESLCKVEDEDLVLKLRGLINVVKFGPVCTKGKELADAYDAAENEELKSAIAMEIRKTTVICLSLLDQFGISHKKTVRAALVKKFGADAVKRFEKSA